MLQNLENDGVELEQKLHKRIAVELAQFDIIAKKDVDWVSQYVREQIGIRVPLRVMLFVSFCTWLLGVIIGCGLK